MTGDARAVNLTGAVALGVATDVTAAVEAATGLAVAEVAALTTLANWADGHSIERLREVTALSQPGGARLVDRLQAAGLARRSADAGDRRVTTVRITPAGRRVVQRAAQAREVAIETWLGRLSPVQRELWGALVATVAGADMADPREANRRCRLCDVSACAAVDDCPVTDAARRARS